MQISKKFRKVAVMGLLASTTLAVTGCDVPTAQEQKEPASLVYVIPAKCVVVDKAPPGIRQSNTYNFRIGHVMFRTSDNGNAMKSSTGQQMKYLKGDDRARALEMFKHLPPCDNCTPPKFNP